MAIPAFGKLIRFGLAPVEDFDMQTHAEEE